MTRKVNVVFGPEYVPGLPRAVVEADRGVKSELELLSRDIKPHT